MKTPHENPDADVLRRSLDAFDRQRRRRQALSVLLLVVAVFFALAMTSLADSAEPRSLHLEIMAGCIAIMFFVGGLAAAVLWASQENTRKILKAIELLAERRSAEGKQ